MGVDIPEDCNSCWLPGKRCNLWLATDVGERHRGCSIRPLPEKHGGLVDVDALKTYFRQGLKDARPEFIYSDWLALTEDIINGLLVDLNKAPIIVEAEGE